MTLVVLQFGLLGAILVVVLAILIAIKFGFNQVIKGLEAIADRLDRPH